MGFKGYPRHPHAIKELPPAALARVLAGEPWLFVWSQELKLSLVTIADRSEISLKRILEIAEETDVPTPEELEAIALVMGTTVEKIEAVQG